MRTDISEIGKVAAIDRLLSKSGIGGATPLKIKEKGECSMTLKNMLEGVDFDLVYTPLKHLGYKAALNAFGELYASLFVPAALSVNLGISSRFCMEDIEELYAGIRLACEKYSVDLVLRV